MPDKRGDAAYAAWDEAARMEHRDAQNITLRFTLDMAEYFRLLMQDKDLAAVITTQATPRKRIPPLRAQCSGNGGWTRCRWNKAACRAYMWWTAEKSCTRRPARPAGIHAFLGRARCDAAQRGGQFLHSRGRRRTEPQPSGRQCAGVRQGAGPRHPVHQFLHAPRIQRIYGMMQKAAGRALCTPGRFALLWRGRPPMARGCFAR